MESVRLVAKETLCKYWNRVDKVVSYKGMG